MSPTSYQTAPPRGGEPRLHLGRRLRRRGGGGRGARRVLGRVRGPAHEVASVVRGLLVAGEVAVLEGVVGGVEPCGGLVEEVVHAGQRGRGRRLPAAAGRR